MRKSRNFNHKRESKVKKLLKIVLPLMIGFGFALFFAPKKLELATPEISYRAAFLSYYEKPKELKLAHKVKSGETIGTILNSYGFASIVTDLNNSLEPLRSQFVLKSGLNLEFKINSEGNLTRLKIPVDRQSNIVVKRDSTAKYEAQLKQISSEEKEKISVGEIESSFAAATSRAGISYEVVDELVDIFSGKISFQRDFRKGDRFVVIYQDNITEEGTSLGNISILAALIEVKGIPFVAVRFVGEDGKSRYFDQKAELMQATFLRYPLKYSRISSGFSNARLHPVLDVKRPHLGVDFAAPIGTPVRTVADGSVIFAAKNGGAGIMVKIQHNPRIATAYLHLSKIEKGIKKGTKVQKGQVIGAVGKTGLATGPHLHFSFYDGGKAINPLKIELPMFELADDRYKINPTYLRRVLFTLNHYRGVTLESFYAAN